MSTTSAAPTAGPALLPPRRAYRDLGDGVVGGVAAGLAHHLRTRLVWVRVGFVVTCAFGGFGLAVYAVLWLLMPAGTPFRAEPPGLESASRDGRRPGVIRRLGDLGPVVVLSVLALGVLFTVGALIGGGTLLWPLLIGLVGIGLLWRQADEAQRARWLDGEGRINPARVVLGDGGWAAWARLASGLVLIGLATVMLALRGGSLSVARDVTVAALLGVVGIGIVVGPWMLRLMGELTDERAERVRTQERADVAAHLHDSVLQTLALIQRNAGDGPIVAKLARAQERDLRSWLYAGEAVGDATVGAALRAAAAEVEDAHGISVDVVTVGDADMVDQLRPVVAAARESMTNAAKHAGVPQVDVYAEIGEDAVDVFVRDRGVGFDLDGVAEDRFGVRRSIVDRMQRHGGAGEVRSTPGEGTEVRLHLPRPAHQNQQSQEDKA